MCVLKRQVKYQKYQMLMLMRYTAHLLISYYLVMIHIQSDHDTEWSLIQSDHNTAWSLIQTGAQTGMRWLVTPRAREYRETEKRAGLLWVSPPLSNRNIHDSRLNPVRWGPISGPNTVLWGQCSYHHSVVRQYLAADLFQSDYQRFYNRLSEQWWCKIAPLRSV